MSFRARVIFGVKVINTKVVMPEHTVLEYDESSGVAYDLIKPEEVTFSKKFDVDFSRSLHLWEEDWDGDLWELWHPVSHDFDLVGFVVSDLSPYDLTSAESIPNDLDSLRHDLTFKLRHKFETPAINVIATASKLYSVAHESS